MLLKINKIWPQNYCNTKKKKKNNQRLQFIWLKDRLLNPANMKQKNKVPKSTLHFLQIKIRSSQSNKSKNSAEMIGRQSNQLSPNPKQDPITTAI